MVEYIDASTKYKYLSYQIDRKREATFVWKLCTNP